MIVVGFLTGVFSVLFRTFELESAMLEDMNSVDEDRDGG